MKKIIIILTLLSSQAFVHAQQITVIPNPDNSFGFSGGLTAFGNSLIGHYINSSTGKTQLAKCDPNNHVTLIPNPDNGTIVLYDTSILYGTNNRSNNFIKFNGSLYGLYISASSDAQLIKYDGNSVVKIFNPPNITLGFINYQQPDNCIYKNNLFLWGYDKSIGTNKLLKFDGINYTAFSLPNGFIFYSNSAFVYNDTLYFFGIKDLPSGLRRHKVLRFYNNTLTEVSNSWFDQGLGMGLFTNSQEGVEFNGKYYFTTDLIDLNNNTDTISLVAFDGNTLQTIKQYYGGCYDEKVTLLNNSIFFNINNSILKYDGTAFNQYNFPQSPSFCVNTRNLLDDKIYYNVPYSNSYKLFSFNGNNLQLYSISDSNSNYFSNTFSLNKNRLCNFLKYPSIAGKPYFYHVGLIDTNSNTITKLNNPDTGIGGYVVDSLNSVGYMIYQNKDKKYQLAYINYNPLPITKISLRLTQEAKDRILLNWQTANETKISHFNVQRSFNGKDFTSISKVAANNKVSNEYEFTDSRLPLTVNGGLFYRIVAVDKNGAMTFSETKRISFNQPNRSLSVYPNPASNIVNITCKNAKQIFIIDYSGRIVKQFNSMAEHQTINTSQFNKGVYIIKAVLNNQETLVEKMIVE